MINIFHGVPAVLTAVVRSRVPAFAFIPPLTFVRSGTAPQLFHALTLSLFSINLDFIIISAYENIYKLWSSDS